MITPVFASAITEGVNQHRVITPAAEIPSAQVLPLGFQELPSEATHIIFSNLFTYTAGKQADMFAACRKQGLKVILDVDDFWQIPETHSKYAQLKGSNYHAEVVQCLKAADMVWCASKLLLDECKKLNKESYYIPNTYGVDSLRARAEGRRFGYVASATDHLRDAKLLQKAFAKFSEENNSFQVGWCGYQQTPQGDEMRQIFASAGHYFIGEYLPATSYLWHFRTIDTVLAPLEKTKWNSYKSALKAVEAGAMGCALICSDAPPYEDFDHGTNCLKARTQMDWYRHIKKLNEEPNLAFDLSCNLKEYVTDVFSPAHWASQRIQLMERL